MNRMRTRLYLSADKPASLHGLATQISGDGFADMHFEVEAKSPTDFYAWLSQVRAGGPELTPESYIALSKQSVVPAPFTSGLSPRDCSRRSSIRRCRPVLALSPRPTPARSWRPLLGCA